MTSDQRIGKYEIAEQIGAGGFGVVYKAWDPFIQRWVALKTCSATDPETKQRFFREAQLAGALQHPNITLIYDFGIEGSTPYFVQEFLTGTDLDNLFETKKLTIEGMVAILLQVCAGLDYAHSRGIVHRDIKPANVRVLEDGTVKVMDFGIAKSLEAESRLTQTGVALGTAGYLAPEQLAGKPLDPRTDLFSLGVMAYEMVTGVRPFTGPNLSNVIYQILNQDPIPPRQRNAGCPARLEKAILKALAKNPAERFASVREFAAELKEVLTSAQPRGSTRRAETTTAMVREELARLGAPPRDRSTATADLAARPLDLVETSAMHPEERPGSRRLVLAGVTVVLVAIGVTALWYFSSGRDARPVRASIPATPVAPKPTPTPAPTPVPTPVVVEIQLFVDPPAEVEVDGKPLGRVQVANVQLTVGRHTILQRIPGYREATSEVEVTSAGQTIKLGLPPFGLLTVVNDMGVPLQGTKVYLDGKLLGPLPLRDRKVEAGTHQLQVVWPDGSEFNEETEIVAGRPLSRVVQPK